MSLLRHYYAIITPLLRHYYIGQNCVIMGPLLRIITLCISIIMSLLRIITIITYYYVFETGQLADVDGWAIMADSTLVVTPLIWTAIAFEAGIRSCESTYVTCYIPWYIACYITHCMPAGLCCASGSAAIQSCPCPRPSPSTSELTWICPVTASVLYARPQLFFRCTVCPTGSLQTPSKHKELYLVFFSTFEPITLTPGVVTQRNGGPMLYDTASSSNLPSLYLCLAPG